MPNSRVTYRFADGEFSFWTMGGRNQRVVFRVRSDTTPSKRATEKGLPRGMGMWSSTDDEITVWLDSHPSYMLI